MIRSITDNKLKDLKMVAKFTCPKCLHPIELEIGEYDIHASEGPCDLCGAHGEISINVTCPTCQTKYHDELVRSW